MHAQLPENYKGNLREVAHVAWPLMVGLLSFTLMDVTDTLMVSWIGKTELAAVGMATAVIFLINSFFVGFFESVKILVSQASGAKQDRLAEQSGIQGVLLAVPCGIAVILLALCSQTIFSIFGASHELQSMAAHHFSLRVWASPFWFITVAAGSFYQGLGNTRLPMRINIVMCMMNLAFCQILIFGLGPFKGYGISGAAYATVLAEVIGMLILLACLLKDTRAKWKWRQHLVTQLTSLGLPVGIRWLLDAGGWTILIVMIARLGESELAANQIATKIMCISILPVYGLAETACVLTGQCTGARHFVALARSLRSTICLALILMGSCGVIFLIFSKNLVWYFQSDPDLLHRAAQTLVLISIYQMIVAFSMPTAGALNGTGDTRFTMLTSITSTWLIMVPLAYYWGFYLQWGASGMWYALIFQEALVAIAVLWRFRSEKWKHHEAIKPILTSSTSSRRVTNLAMPSHEKRYD